MRIVNIFFIRTTVLGKETKKQEAPKSINSTTQERYNILENKKNKILDFNSAFKLTEKPRKLSEVNLFSL